MGDQKHKPHQTDVRLHLARTAGAWPARRLHRTPGVPRVGYQRASPEVAEGAAEAMRAAVADGGEIRAEVVAAAIEQLEACADEVRRLRRLRRRLQSDVARSKGAARTTRASIAAWLRTMADSWDEAAFRAGHGPDHAQSPRDLADRIERGEDRGR